MKRSSSVRGLTVGGRSLDAGLGGHILVSAKEKDRRARGSSIQLAQFAHHSVPVHDPEDPFPTTTHGFKPATPPLSASASASASVLCAPFLCFNRTPYLGLECHSRRRGPPWPPPPSERTRELGKLR